MQEQLRKKFQNLTEKEKEDMFVKISVEYVNLKDKEKKEDVTDKLISKMFKQLKSSNLDKSKKANLRKIILELESSKSSYLYKYLKTFNVFI